MVLIMYRVIAMKDEMPLWNQLAEVLFQCASAGAGQPIIADFGRKVANSSPT
jgi:hypothetical protein